MEQSTITFILTCVGIIITIAWGIKIVSSKR